MQMIEMRVPLFFLSGFICLGSYRALTLYVIHLSRSTSSSFGVHGIGRGFSYSLPPDFLFFSLVDTAMACGVDLHSLGLLELGLTD